MVMSHFTSCVLVFSCSDGCCCHCNNANYVIHNGCTICQFFWRTVPKPQSRIYEVSLQGLLRLGYEVGETSNQSSNMPVLEFHFVRVVHCLLEFVHVYAVFWDFCLEKMSCKSFLKLQVVIISLDAFQVFCEARVNTRSPLSIGSTTACRKTSVSIPHS